MKDIVIFLIDCLRKDVLDRLEQKSKLKGITALFKDKIEFNNVFSVGSKTIPAVASLLTGCYPYKHGLRTLYGYKLNSSISTLAEILKEKGYRTEAYVTGPFLQENGLSRGFDVFDYRQIEQYVHSDWGVRLIEILNEKHNKPRFILVHFWELHSPRQVIKKYSFLSNPLGFYQNALLSLDHFFYKMHQQVSLNNKMLILTGDHGEEISLLEWFWKYFRKGSLKALGVEKKKDRKIIWNNFKKYTVDKLQLKIGHGFSLRDELIKIPLWITNLENINKFPYKMVNKSINSQIDIFPTLLDILNVPMPKGIDGISLFSEYQHKAIYLEECIPLKPDVNQVLKGVRTERYKYICHPFLGVRQEELQKVKGSNKK